MLQTESWNGWWWKCRSTTVSHNTSSSDTLVTTLPKRLFFFFFSAFGDSCAHYPLLSNQAQISVVGTLLGFRCPAGFLARLRVLILVAASCLNLCAGTELLISYLSNGGSALVTIRLRASCHRFGPTRRPAGPLSRTSANCNTLKCFDEKPTQCLLLPLAALLWMYCGFGPIKPLRYHGYRERNHFLVFQLPVMITNHQEIIQFVLLKVKSQSNCLIGIYFILYIFFQPHSVLTTHCISFSFSFASQTHCYPGFSLAGSSTTTRKRQVRFSARHDIILLREVIAQNPFASKEPGMSKFQKNLKCRAAITNKKIRIMSKQRNILQNLQ